MKTIQKRDLGALDGLRVLATLAIFLYHAGILKQGAFPVTFFFMLSGFLLYYTKHTLTGYPSFRAWLGYVGKKLREFYPLHLLTFLYACILFRPTWSGEKIKSAVGNLLLLQAFSQENQYSFNSLSWYLSALIFLYVISYFLIRFLNRYGRYRKYLIGAVLVMIALCNSLLWMELPVYIYGNPLYRILDVLLGMLSAHLFLEKKQVAVEKKTADRRELAICVVFAVGYFVSLWLKPECGYYSVLFAMALPVFARGEGCVSTVLRGKLFGVAARCSFAFYMLHELVLKTFRQIISPETMGYYPRAFLITAIAFPVTAFLAWVYNQLTGKRRSR
jgi:peptidoglycan/LPS O-acetylase OafA/YrhL